MKEDKIRIPIDKKIDEFKLHLKSHPRTILSARYGDGKSYFLQNMKEECRYSFEFLTIFPINYQVEDNKDIFELVKRDILLQMLANGMIAEDYEIKDSVALAFFLKYNMFDSAIDLFSLLTEFNVNNKLTTSFLLALKGIKFIEDLRKKYEEFKEQGSKENIILKFLDKTDKLPSVETDAITTIIKDNIKSWKKDNNKDVVLVFEDMDRIDPAHLFRIMNVLSAHIDHQYCFGTNDDEYIVGNKFGVDNVVLVLDYDNLRSIFHHFYGKDTKFEGYIHKFSPRGCFRYSINEERINYIYQKIAEVSGLELSEIEGLIKEEKLKDKEIRVIAEALSGVDNQISDKVRIKQDGKDIVLSHKILKLLVIMRRIGYKDSEIVNVFIPYMEQYQMNFLHHFTAYALKEGGSFPFGFILRHKELNYNDYIHVAFNSLESDGDSNTTYSRYDGDRIYEYTDYHDLISFLLQYISQ